jgi:hypothetical protein
MVNRLHLMFIALLLISNYADAQQRPALLILNQPPGINIRYGDPPGAGLVWAGIDLWAQTYMNKRAAAQIRGFQDATNGTDWNALAEAEFSCFGIAAGGSCREVLRFDGDDKALLQTLRSSGVTHALVLTIVQLYDGTAYRARATIRDVESGQQSLQERRLFTAIYETFPPLPLLEQGKTNPTALWAFWNDKSAESKLISEGRASMKELASMLTELDKSVALDRGSDPIGWKALKPISAAEASGRAQCHGICSGTQVFKDDGSRLWLASSGGRGPYGWILLSLDNNAAMFNANLMAYTLQPILVWKWAQLPSEGNQ